MLIYCGLFQDHVKCNFVSKAINDVDTCVVVVVMGVESRSWLEIVVIFVEIVVVFGGSVVIGVF